MPGIAERVRITCGRRPTPNEPVTSLVRETAHRPFPDGGPNRYSMPVEMVLLQSWVENREHSFLRRLASIMAQPA